MNCNSKKKKKKLKGITVAYMPDTPQKTESSMVKTQPPWGI